MKLLVKTVASTAVVLVALAGCASRSSGGGTSAAGSGSDASSSTSPGGSTSTTNGSQSGAPGSAPGGSPSTGATSGGSTSGSQPSSPDSSGQVKYLPLTGVSLDKDGITLVTEVSWGGCNDEPQLVVTSQDASKVVVELKQTSHQRIGVMCPDIAREGAAKVKLAAPLGSRQVIDGIKNVPLTVH